MRKGAEINIRNNEGKIPLNLANELDNIVALEPKGRDDMYPNKQNIIHMFDRSQPRNEKRKSEPSPSDSNEENKPGCSKAKEARISGTNHQSMEIDDESESGSSQQFLNTQETGQSGGNEGLRKSYHGILYQVHWLMMVALESQEHVSGFKFGTEVGDKDAGKFDDVVWEYKKGEETKYNFLQAKHKIDGHKKITFEDLRGKSSPFHLEKYFRSYRDTIKRNKKYRNEKNEEQVENLIIVANIDLDEEFKKSFEKPKRKIPVLDFGRDPEQEEECAYWQFKKSDCDEKKKEIVEILKNMHPLVKLKEEENNLIKLAEHLGRCVLNNEPVFLPNDDFLERYYKVSKDEIIEGEKFCINFIEGKGLSGPIENLQKAFFEYLDKEFKEREKSINKNYVIKQPEDFAKALVAQVGKGESSVVKIDKRKKHIRENIGNLAKYVLIEQNGDRRFNPTFWEAEKLPDASLEVFRDTLKKSEATIPGLRKLKFKINNFKTCQEMLVDKNAFRKGLESFSRFEDISKNIEDFLDKLVIAVNYSKERLRGIIERELREKIGWIANDFIADAFQCTIAKALDATEDGFISNSEAVKEEFKKMREKRSQIETSGITLEYRHRIEDSGIKFLENLSAVTDFLSSNETPVLILIYPRKTILNSIKVYQTVKDSEYKNDDKHIFIPLSSLLSTQPCVMEAFKSSELLVIEDGLAESEVDEPCTQLLEVINSDPNKKIILITQECDRLAAKFKEKHSDKCKSYEDKECSFTDLEVASQDKLLDGEKVKFQGKEVMLRKLVTTGVSDHLIDGEVLSMLIEKKEMKIGSEVPQKSDHGSPAYNIITPEEIKIERLQDEDLKDELFVISGAKKEDLRNRQIPEAIFCSYDDLDLNNEKPKQFVLLDSKDRDENIKVFETVCRYYPNKTIHFIEFKDDKFMWNRYYDPNFHTDRKFYRIQIDATKLSKYYDTENNRQTDKLIVSGIKGDKFEKDYKINRKVIHRFEDDNSGQQEDELNGSNCHWLESKETKLFWKHSQGQTLKLSRLIVRDPGNDLTHEDFLKLVKDTKCTVIADSAGMGKSTTSTLLLESYKGKEGLDWVIRVDLRDYSSEIAELPDECNTLDEVVEFFSGKELQKKFAKNLFRHRLKEENNMLLLFDGFDEISSGQEGDNGQFDKQEKMRNLLKYLKGETKARIVVTTRPYKEQETSLENELSVLSHTFKPIEKEQRQKFFENFWKRSLKLQYSKEELGKFQYEKFARDLNKKFDEAVNDEKSTFMGIPLHLRMLAEVHFEKFKIFGKDGQTYNSEDLNIFDLYKNFVDRKYNIYLSEKTDLSSASGSKDDLIALKESYEKKHKHLAFKYLFSSSAEHFKLFWGAEPNRMSNENTRDLQRIGIIQPSNKDDADFIHRTLAEYFVSILIFERLKNKLQNPNYSQESKENMRIFLLNHIFHNRENNVIRRFIDSQMAGSTAELKKFWSDGIVSIEKKKQLILAVEEGLGGIFRFLLRSTEDEKINKDLISIPRKEIEELCDEGNYKEASLLPENALKFLTEELGENHLEVAIMRRYLGNAQEDLNVNDNHTKRAKLLEQALDILDKHLEVAEGEDPTHEDDYFQQALSAFEKDFSNETRNTEDQGGRRNEWIRVLKINIGRTKRNLANACGDLHEYERKKTLLEEEVLPIFQEIEEEANEELIKRLRIERAKAIRNLGNAYGKLGDDNTREECLEKALELFKERLNDTTIEESIKKDLELRIAETKRNLGNVHGKLRNHEKKMELLEEALPLLKDHYGLLHSIVTKAQKNLSEAYIELGCPFRGAVIAGEYEVGMHDESKDKKRDDMASPLYLAVREGHRDIVETLANREDSNIQDEIEKCLNLAEAEAKKSNRNSQIYQEIIRILKNCQRE